MNKVFLIGRLSRDPELRHTTSGMPVCQINVAISRPVSQGTEPQTDFINVVVWNKQAENVARYLSKGRQIAVEGRIQTRNYDNNKTTTNSNPFDENPFDTMGPSMDTTSVDNDPFASFGEKVEISDNELPF